MRPLLYIVVALSVMRGSSAAPQPLSLINMTTISDLNDEISTVTVDSAILDDSQKSTKLDTVTVEEIKDTDLSTENAKAVSLSELENNSESILLREDSDGTTDSSSVMEEKSSTSISVNTKPPTITTRIEISTLKDILTTTEIPLSKQTEDEDNNKSEIPLSRYVPPLDPMKHMLMMSDARNTAKIPNVEKTLSTTSPSPTVTIFTTETISKTEPTSTENFDSAEKVVPESSEVAEKHEFLLADAAPRELETSTIPEESEDGNVSEELKGDSTDEVSSTQTALFRTTSNYVEEVTVASTEIDEAREENGNSALHKNFEASLKSEAVMEKGSKEDEEYSEATTAIFATTEEAIKVDVTKIDNLLKHSDEGKSETPQTPFTDSGTTTEKTRLTIEYKTEENLPENTSVKSELKEISTTSTSTTAVPETTFEFSTPGTLAVEIKTENISLENMKEVTKESAESEEKIISLEDELEFRAVKLPFNSSKVVYSENRPNDVVHPLIIEDSTLLDNKIESTTTSILTSIAELLFSSPSTTEVVETTVKNEEETAPNREEPEISDLSLEVDKIDISDSKSDAGAIFVNDSSDMLKVQPIKAGLDSVPSDDISTEISDETVTETLPKELFEAQTTKSTELVSPNEVSLSTENDETTAEAETTPESISSSDHTTATERDPTIVTAVEIKAEVTDVNTSFSDQPELENDPAIENKPSDYLLNVKDRYVSGDNRDMVAAVQFLHYHDKASSEQCFKLVDAHWNYATNLTEENKKKQLEQTLEYSLFHKEAWKNATSFAWKSFNDTLLRRWFKSLSVLGTAALPEEKLNEFNKLKAEMKNIYSTAKICPYVSPQSPRKGQIITEKDCNLTLEPDLQRILTKSRDYDELVHVWKAWRDAAGKPIREKYLRFVNLSNEAAHMNGFSDTGDMWREAYESETFEADLEDLWEQLKPLYEHLHAYVRRRLIRQYGADKIKDDGPIPAHLFGNMWAQSWVSLLDITQPFPGKPSVDVTPIMEAKNLTAYEMFKISEEFFTSLGLKPMPEEFWKHSLIERPKDREIICHASAWDFCNGKDYRIKQCTDITMEDLITVHHEMGHIQYFLQYARQPNVFREGANPGFHEAIGDVLALSVSTPKHLQSIGLLDEVADDPEGDLNFLLYTALDKVSFLPSGYLIDLWRWGLFSGDIKPEEMNSKWWELRLKYQGICPPVKRTDTDFDPGAKFHVPGNVPYIRYFVSFVIQFQFHKVLCDAAGHTGPLYKCDIYRSKEAGQILSQVMELGSSEHWCEAMKIMTGGGTNKMDAGPILEYFEPLLEFLKEQNKNETLGWRSNDATMCP